MKTKRILSVLITVVMLIGMLPTAVFAADTTEATWAFGTAETAPDEAAYTYSGTLAEAFTAANGNVDATNTVTYVKLNKDVSMTHTSSATALTLNEGKAMVLDLNSKTYSSSTTSTSGGHVTYGFNTAVNSLLTVKNGKISVSSSNDGYAIGIASEGTLNVLDCTIEASKSNANSGAHSISYSGGVATITNCTITATSAGDRAYGIEIGTTTPALTIADCTVNAIGGDEAYAFYASTYWGKMEFDVAGTITATCANGAFYSKPTTNPVTVTAGADAENAGELDATIAATYTNNKYVKLVPAHTHCICGATHASVGDHTVEDEKTFTAVSTYDELVTAAATGGNYYLANDIEITNEIEARPQEPFNLCLNGNTLFAADDMTGNIFDIRNNSLTLTDCVGGGKLTGTQASAVYVWNTFNMYGGAITENNGTGVYLAAEDAVFNMYGGEITNNKAYYGAGIYHHDGTIRISGGTIAGNVAQTKGGAIYTRRSGIEICGNPVIAGNYVNSGADGEANQINNIDAYSIEIVGPMTDGASIGMTKVSEEFGYFAIDTYDSSADYSKYFFSDKGYPVYKEDDTYYFGYRITKQPSDTDYSVEVNSTNGANYQWCEIIKEEPVPVDDEYLDGINGVGIGDYGENGWSALVDSGASMYFAIVMNPGDELTAKFASAPQGEVILANGDTESYAPVVSGGENTYTFTAVDAGIHILAVFAEDAPTVKATLTKNTLKEVDGQTAATLDTGNLPTGNYACQITWDYLNTPDDTSDDYILQSVVVEYIVPQYTVSFDANGGSGEMGDQEIRKGEATALYENTFTRTGYTFAGWATSSNGAKVYDDKQLVTDIASQDETITLYAVWTANTNTPYTVRYFTQTLDAAKAGNAEENNTNYTLADSKTYYGTSDDSVWAERIDIKGFTKPTGKMITISPDGTTVYDYYYARGKYNIYINDVDGVASVSGAGAYFFEEEVTISATVEAGYKWIGWGGSITASEQTYKFTMSSSGSITLTPQLEEKATVVIDETTQFADYDGTAKTFSIISDDSPEGFTITYKQNGQNVTPINAGCYDVVLSRAEDENYKAYSKTLANGLIINKIVVDEPNVGDKPYNGSMQTADITGTEIYEVIENAGGTDVGAYDVILTLKDTTNYKWKLAENSGATATRKFYIIFTENTWDAEPQITGWTYGQSPNAPTFDAKFGEVSVEYKKTSEDESAYTTNVPENAGNYNVKFTVSATTNFGGLSKVIDLNISKATPSLESPTAQNSITYGAKLNTVGLPTGWLWLDGDTIPTVVNSGYSAYYTPADTNNYDWTVINGWNATESRVERTVAVTVGKASVAVPTGLTATYGDTLANVTLPTGWTWKDATTTSVGNAGTKTFAAVFTPDDTDNYNTVEADLEVNVERQKVEKPAENTTVFTYNGNEQIYTLTENARYEITNNKRTDAGNQTVAITLKDSANYEWTDGSVGNVEYTFTIGKATAEITVDTTSIDKTYGVTFTLPTATSTFGTPVCDKTVAQMSDVGSYEVTYSVAETLNYFGDTETVSVTINPAMVTKPTANNTDFVYNGSMQTYSVSPNSNYTVSGNTRTDAGEQTVTVTLNDKHNYRWDDNTTDDVTFTFTIAQKEIGIEWGTTQFTYNKTEQKPTATATGLVTGDSCEIAVIGGQTNAGNGYVATAESLSNANYKLPTSKTTTFNIAQKSVAITGITIEDTKVYDRETNAVITNYGIVSNVIDGDIVTVNTASATATYNDANVGNGKAVAFAGFAISGADASNYELSAQPPSTTANITAKDIAGAVIALGESLTYNGNEQAQTIASATVDGLTITYEVSGNVNTNAGDYTLTITGNENFTGTAQKAYTIAKRDATLETVPSAITPLTYNAAEQTLVSAGENVVGGTLVYKLGDGEYSAELPTATNAGSYTVYYKVIGDSNHNDTDEQSFEVTISQKVVSPAIILTTPVPNQTPVTNIETDEYTATIAWSPDVTDKFAYSTDYTATITITPKGNYTLTGVAENGYTIEGATVTNPADSGVITVVFPKTSSRPSSGGGTTRYTVKFDTDGGSEIASKTVTRNSKIAEPTAPEKEGYTFMGWFTDESLTVAYDFDSKVTKHFTLYAKWEKVDDEAEDTDTHNCPSKAYDDLDVNAWYHEDTDYVIENGIFKGIGETTFAPNDKLTRAMLVTVLYRMENEPATNRSIPFSDVDMGAYYANAVSWAKQNGIVNGVTENEFAPNDNITREQIAAIMMRYAVYKGMDAITLEENLHFADADEISEYAVSSMNWAVGTGLMNGKSATTLNPKDNATRAEIAAILHRFMEANK